MSALTARATLLILLLFGLPDGKAACPTPAADFAKIEVKSLQSVRTEGAVGDSTNKFMRGTADEGQAKGLPVVELRDEIRVKLDGLETLLEREKCSTTKKNIVLFLDDRPVSVPPFPRVDPSTGELSFKLQRNEASRDTWTRLLGSPSFAERRVKVSVGVEDDYPVKSEVFIALGVIPRGLFWFWAGLLVVLVTFFGALARNSDVLRDVGPEPGSNARKPYSLAKTQAAWWFFLILTSYLFIGLITGDYATPITGTVLALMGISSATAIGSATIDTAKPVAAAVGKPGGPADVVAPAQTKGRWWMDILTDETGVNFHRFQMVAWTAVLGLIFVLRVYKELAMPQFDAVLLGLLGISAGTYLGLKTTAETKTK